MYVEGLEIRPLAASEPGCLLTVAQTNWAHDGVSRLPGNDDHLATDQYGRSTMP